MSTGENYISSNTAVVNIENNQPDEVNDDVIRMYKYTKRKIYDLIRNHEYEIGKLKKSLRKFDEIMYKKCKHDWERDPPQMYTLSSYTCKKCYLSK